MLSAEYLTKIDNLHKSKNPEFPSITEIYTKSIVDWDELYESMTVMECKTSNNFEIINRLPFYTFRIKAKYLNKYIEAENKNANGGDAENPQETANSAFENNQRQAKSMLKGTKNQIKPGKAPKIK